MSRAFVKELEDRPERPLARPIDEEHPNYVTAGGLTLLREALERARERGDDRDTTYFEARIASAQLVESCADASGEVEFGSTVVVREESGRTVRLRIVGADEADPLRGSISWISPYAQALLGRRLGERVVVQRPAGAATVTIDAIEQA